MILLFIGASVALVCFIIYALERKSKNEKIVWEDALKLALFGGIISSGVVFATSIENVKEVVSTLPTTSGTQDMFVGTPAF